MVSNPHQARTTASSEDDKEEQKKIKRDDVPAYMVRQYMPAHFGAKEKRTFARVNASAALQKHC